MHPRRIMTALRHALAGVRMSVGVSVGVGIALTTLAATLTAATATPAEAAAFVASTAAAPAGPAHLAPLAPIPAGSYTPLRRSASEPDRVSVPAFQLDARPVTNADFLAFVRALPRWQRSRVSPLWADSGYLAHWAGDLEPGPGAPLEAPVVRVSWFAAQAFAAWAGKRLPSTAEWERAATTGFTTEEGRTEPAFRAHLVRWLSTPTPPVLPAVAVSPANLHGVHDLHGLVWEWVEDFETTLGSGETRSGVDGDQGLFCGASAADAADRRDYAAFVRAGLRSSLRAAYTVPNLGFRCAADLPPSPLLAATTSP